MEQASETKDLINNILKENSTLFDISNLEFNLDVSYEAIQLNINSNGNNVKSWDEIKPKVKISIKTGSKDVNNNKEIIAEKIPIPVADESEHIEETPLTKIQKIAIEQLKSSLYNSSSYKSISWTELEKDEEFEFKKTYLTTHKFSQADNFEKRINSKVIFTISEDLTKVIGFEYI